MVRKKSRQNRTKRKQIKNTCRSKKHDFYFSSETKVKLGRFYWKIKRTKFDFIIYAPRTIKLFSKKVKYVFKNPKILGQGGFGAVLRYKDTEHNLDIVLKIEGGKTSDLLGNRRLEPSEKEISEVLNKNGFKCNTIRSRYIESRGLKYKKDHYYIMEEYTGNTLDILRKLAESDMSDKEQIKIWLNIVETVRKQIVCLAKLGYYYMDLKPQNILYCKNPDKSLSINLGDLGAAVPVPDIKVHLTPFLPPEYYTNSGIKIIENGKINVKKGVAALLFLLGMLSLWIADVYDFYYSYIDLLYDENLSIVQIKRKYKEEVERVLRESPVKFNKKQSSLIKKLLTLSPIERLSKVDITKPFSW